MEEEFSKAIKAESSNETETSAQKPVEGGVFLDSVEKNLETWA